jgi:prepilin-type N-terminal cleavage/methylation domain-containing protein
MRLRRRAFSLLEVSLVLALLVLIGAIVYPRLDGLLADRRLRSAADQLRADFTRARVAAMESGRAHAMQFESATGRYVVIPLDDLSDSDPFALPSAGGGVPSMPVVAGMLPEQITLLRVTAADDVKPPPAMGGLAAGGPDMQSFGAPPTGAAAAAGPLSVVYFHPDGTTSSAIATLAGEFELLLDVRLRGLTGGTSVGDVYTGDSAAGGGPAGAIR